MSMGDIWAINGINFASAINDILDRDDFTLEDLLKEDELLQEIKAKNGRLLEVLSTEDNIVSMIDYIIEPAPEDASDLRQFRYPYMSCQVFCCEIDEILQAFQEDTEGHLLTRLFSILETPSPLDPYLAGYFEKTLGILLRRLTVPLMTHINRDGLRMLLLFLRHVDNYSVMQVIQRLMLPHIPFSVQQGSDEQSPDGFEGGGSPELSAEEAELGQCHWSYFEETPALLLEQMLFKGAAVAGASTEAVAATDAEASEGTDEAATPGVSPVDIPTHIADLLITVLQLSPAESPFLVHICEVTCLQQLFQAALSFDGRQVADGAEPDAAALTSAHSTDCVSLSSLTVLESIISRLSEALVLLGNLPEGGSADDSGEFSEEMLRLQQLQAAEVGLFIHLNIQNVCIAVRPFIGVLASEMEGYISRPSGVLRSQSGVALRCLGHRGLQLVKLVETLVRFVICELGGADPEEGEGADSTTGSAAASPSKKSGTGDDDAPLEVDRKAQRAMVAEIIPALCEAHVLRHCWELCLQYRSNSLLHLSVQRILLMLLDNDTPLRSVSQQYLVEQTSLLPKMMELLRSHAEPPAAAPPVEEGVEPLRPRYCYGAKPFSPLAGHLVQLARAMQQALGAEQMADTGGLRRFTSALDDSALTEDSIADQDLEAGSGTVSMADGTAMSNLAKKLEALEMRLGGAREGDAEGGVDTSLVDVSTSSVGAPNTLRATMEAAIVEGDSLFNVWRTFVDEFPQYFADEDAPVIVFPNSGGQESSMDAFGALNESNEAAATQFLFYGTDLKPPSLFGEDESAGDDDDDEDDEYLYHNDGNDSDDDGDFYNNGVRYAEDDDEDDEDDEGFGGSPPREPEFHATSKYYTPYSPEDLESSPTQVAEDFNPFGFVNSPGVEFEAEGTSSDGSPNKAADFAAFEALGAEAPGSLGATTNMSVTEDPFGDSSSTDFNAFVFPSTDESSNPANQSEAISSADPNDPFGDNTQATEDPFGDNKTNDPFGDGTA